MRRNVVYIFCIPLVTLVVSTFVVTSFLSHWSLLDGSSRNSLQMFLDGQAHRPFAYRVLAPELVKQLDAILPESVKVVLANKIAPPFRIHFVQPLLQQYESLHPGISFRAEFEWARDDYRRRYVLMVLLMLISFAAAMLFVRHSAILLGASEQRATITMLLYAFVVPTMFLNGGYFYDFTEQLGATALIYCVLKTHWRLAFLVLLAMQANKETAILMVLFLLPFISGILHWQVLFRVGLVLLLCIMMIIWVRVTHSSLPGESSEWHLQDNIAFWFSAKPWFMLEDFYSIGLALPRMTFLCFSVIVLMRGWICGRTPCTISATIAFFVLASLLLTMGYRDEFRNLSLATPFLALLVIECKAIQKGRLK